MKTTIFGFFIALFALSSFAQNLNFSIHGKYEHPITKETLAKASSMGDIIPHYPASWIDSYNTVELTVRSNNNTATAKSTNDLLSEDQLKLIASLDFGAELAVNIGYQSMNSVAHQIENRSMQYSATVVPEQEAAYSDGYEQLSSYINQKAIEKISASDSKELQLTVVRFTVNEAGKITGSRIEKTSGIESVDRLLLDVIDQMPDWQPAADVQGQKVSQEFELVVSNGNDGC